MATEQERKSHLALLAKQHPDKEISLVTAAGREFYLASPSRDIWHAFRDAVADPRRAKVANENFCTRCAVEPDGAALGDLFIKKPALAETLAAKLAVLAGIDEKAEIAFFEIA